MANGELFLFAYRFDAAGRSAWRAAKSRRRGALSCAAGLTMLGACGALAQSPAPNAGLAPIPGSTPVNPDSGEFIETPIGTAAPAPAAATPTPVGPGAPVEPPIAAAAASAAPGASGAGPLGLLSTNSHSSNLLGDMWGLRPVLSQIRHDADHPARSSEVLGNVSGGVRQGFDYDGLTTATLQMDTQRAFGLIRRPVQRQRVANSRRAI